MVMEPKNTEELVEQLIDLANDLAMEEDISDASDTEEALIHIIITMGTMLEWQRLGLKLSQGAIDELKAKQ